MDSKILFSMHIMWYESKMINETLDSIQNAIQHGLIPVELIFCLNSQTYIETPIIDKSESMFDEFINHPLLKKSKIIYKTDNDPFYNIGDWRREQYNENAKYTIWGESDCLLPEDFFYILSSINIDEPHILTFSSRKMWDYTWDIVEHKDLQKYKRSKEHIYQAPFPFNSCDIINQNQLNDFNNNFEIEIIKLDDIKIDGSLLCLSNNINYQLIPNDMSFVREDFCAQQILKIKKIPQYHITTRIKGHNYSHPLKRTNTKNTRDDKIFQIYSEKSQKAMLSFVLENNNQ